jgi:hypothetical protein
MGASLPRSAPAGTGASRGDPAKSPVPPPMSSRKLLTATTELRGRVRRGVANTDASSSASVVDAARPRKGAARAPTEHLRGGACGAANAWLSECD